MPKRICSIKGKLRSIFCVISIQEVGAVSKNLTQRLERNRHEVISEAEDDDELGSETSNGRLSSGMCYFYFLSLH